MKSKIQEEFLDYMECGFQPLVTGDGSFTLIQDQTHEEMHSREGAFSESVYIYQRPLEDFIEKVNDFELISVGLGLGYNEILAAQLGVKYNRKFKIISYEKEDHLRKLFLKRITHPENYPHYFQVFEDLDPSAVSEFLNENTEFKADLNQKEVESWPYQSRAILFDAYSNKTTQELWETQFLDLLLSKCRVSSMLSTYASTGDLNRSLVKAGFKKVKKRAGFAYKRESTLAHLYES